MKIQAQHGASAIEFAFVLPLLVMLVFGIIEFSVALYDKAVITNASREGARAGVVARYDPVTGNYNPLNDGEISTVVRNYCGNHLITFGGHASVTTTVNRLDKDGGSFGSGDDLHVTASYPYGYLVLPNFVAGLAGPINLSATTVMRME